MTTKSRDRSPLKREINSNNSNSIEINLLNSNNIMAHATLSEINIAKEMIPKYDGGNRNLSYFLLQCDKFRSMFRNNNPGQENCLGNILLFEICCSRLEGAARDALVASNITTLSQMKETLLNRFGDPRNETLLANDLNTCFQAHNESYENYYENIKFKLQQLIEHITIREQSEDIKTFKLEMYSKNALSTFKAGLLEPYRTHISHQIAQSIEDCLLALRNYDNQKQQIEFLNFVRNKTPIRRNATPNKPFNKNASQFNNQNPNRGNFQPPAQNTNFYPNFNTNFNNNPRPYSNFNNNNNFNTRYNNQQYQRGPSRFVPPYNGPNNFQNHNRKPEPEPTPMSISTRNTFNRSNNFRTFNRPNNNFNNNHFKNTGPSNFIAEELYNVENPEFSEEEQERNNYESHTESENFRVEASEDQ